MDKSCSSMGAACPIESYVEHYKTLLRQMERKRTNEISLVAKLARHNLWLAEGQEICNRIKDAIYRIGDKLRGLRTC